MTQQFNTVDVLRLEVEDDPTGLVNLIPNPNGELGGWGWVTPVVGSFMTNTLYLDQSQALVYESPGSVASWFYSEPMAVTAGQYAAASWRIHTIGGYYRASLEWLAADKTTVLTPGTPAKSGYQNAVGVTVSYGPFQAPTSTAYVRLRFDHYSNTSAGNPTAGQKITFTNVTVAKAATAPELGSYRANLVPNPSFETNTTGWVASGTGVSIARTTSTAAQSGAASLSVTGAATSVATRTNLVPNPSFEVGTTGWVGGTRGTGTTDYGSYRLNINPETRTALPGNTYNIPVVGSQAYTLSYGVVRASGSGTFTRDIVWYNAGGTAIGSTSQSPTATTTMTRQSKTVTAPSNAAFVVIGFDATANTYIDGVMLEQAASAGTYFDGDSADAGNNTYDWTGTAHASTSTETVTTQLSTVSQGAQTTLTATGGKTYMLSAYHKTASTGRAVEWQVEWLTGGSVVGTAAYAVGTDSTSWVRRSQTVTAPSGADSLRWTLRYDTLAYGEVHYIDAVMVEQTSSLDTYFDGSTTDAGGVDYAWFGTAHASTSTATTSNLAYIESVQYLNILGPAHDIKVNREELNIGTLTATILDSALDPSQSELIRPGRRVRLTTLLGPTWIPLFTGKVSKATVTYSLKDPAIPESKRARIELTAVDALAELANQKRPEGVATIEELPYVLEGCGVPWNISGSGAHVPTATVVAYNDNASALDQIAITRDTNLMQAWVDVTGVVRVSVNGSTYGTTVTSDFYSDLDIDYDTERCINEVNIKFLRFNPSTLETEEVPYGPIRDEASIAEWGVRSAEFTVQGISEETADLEEYAQAILDANGTPRVKVNSMVLPIKTLDWPVSSFLELDIASAIGHLSYLDIEDDYTHRITSIEHSITPDKWLMTWGFRDADSVASPQFTPSPQTGAGGKTIGQLLRPVGEITMYGGATAPDGWLVCDGDSVLVADYPDLFAAIGYAHGGAGASFNLPNLVDRFPIGAGTKALGTSGGDATKTLTVPNLPSHGHPINRKSGVGTSTGVARGNASAEPDAATDNTGSGTAFDVMPPWRSLNFIIRVV